MEQLFYKIKSLRRKIKTFFEQHPLPCRCKFNPKKSPPRSHAPVSSLYLLDYDRRIAELGLEHEPPILQITGQRLTFRKGRWGPPLNQGPYPCSQSEVVRSIREKNKVLEDQNNMLQLKLELAMDMLTEATANLMMLQDEEEEKTEEDQVNEKKEGESKKVEIMEDEELVEEEEKKASLKKIPKQPRQHEVDLDYSELENDDLLTPTRQLKKYLVPLTSEDENDFSVEASPKFVSKKRQGEAKPKVCPMRRAGQARAKLRESLYSLPPMAPGLPKSPKSRSSPKVCRLELEEEPKPRTPRKRRPKPKPKLAEETNGTCPLKRRSRI